jgi:protein-disulfide isomerase
MRIPLGILALAVLGVSALVAPAGRAQESVTCVGGTPAAPIQIEVFSDYQCPACRAFYLQTMRTVLRDYADKGKACVIYREFPLTQHQHARVAARYGLAAMQLGQRQWALVTDALFAEQDNWGANGNVEAVVAKALNPTDMAAVRKQLQNPAKLDAVIDREIQLGIDKTVNSTPTFFVTAKGKTQKFAAAYQYTILQRYLDSLLSSGN